MTSSKNSPDASGDALLAIVSIAVIVTVAAESAFIFLASWTVLPLIVLFVVLAAVAVVGAVGRLIDHGELATGHRVSTHPEAETIATWDAPSSASAITRRSAVPRASA